MEEVILHEHILTSHTALVNMILRMDGIRQAKETAIKAGVSIFAIFMAVLPFVLKFVMGGGLDIQGIIAAIMALITGK